MTKLVQYDQRLSQSHSTVLIVMLSDRSAGSVRPTTLRLTTYVTSVGDTVSQGLFFSATLPVSTELRPVSSVIFELEGQCNKLVFCSCNYV